MADDKVTILKVGTKDAVKNIQDLKNNVKILKKDLETLDIGSTQYQKTLKVLNENQRALKDAMYATSASMSQVSESAKGLNVQFDENNQLVNSASVSYNELVNTMAALKQEWRSTTDAMKRNKIGEQIFQINNELKLMDAQTGNFSRNVGNYAGSITKAFGMIKGDLSKISPAAATAAEGVGFLANSIQLAASATNPLVAGIAIATTAISALVSIFSRQGSAAEEAAQRAAEAEEKAAERSKDAWETFFNGLFDNNLDRLKRMRDIAESEYKLASNIGGFFLVGAYGKDWMQENLGKTITGSTEYFKSLLESLRKGEISMDKFREGIEAVEGSIKNARYRSENYEDALYKYLESEISIINEEKKLEDERQKKLKESRKKMLDITKDYTEDEIDALDAAYEKEMDAQYEFERKQREEKRKAEEQKRKDQKAYDDALFAQNEEERKRREEAEKAETDRLHREQERRKAIITASVGAITDILASIADAYESDTEHSEKNAKKIKALRIASATIDTISGALGAYMQSVATIPPPAGIAVGALQAAAVTAAGAAQISQIRNTDISANGTAASPQMAMQTAPNIPTRVTNVRSITSASEEDRLNQMAKDQKVYILASDIQASQSSIKTQIQESSF